MVKINFVGDIAFFPLDFEKQVKKFDIKNYTDLLDSDLLIGNFEFPYSEEKNRFFQYSHEEYLAPFDSVNVLEQFNFDVLSLATNHILDWGKEGIEKTEKVLAEKNIKTLGAGENDKHARKPVIIEKGGIDFGFLAYCKKGDFSATDEQPGAALIEKVAVIDDILDLKAKVDHVIVILHWGVEFSNYPYPPDQKLARSFVDAGASCIVGHHPHVIQGVENYKGKPIFYSLGSFIYNPFAERIFSGEKLEQRLKSMVASIIFNKAGGISWDFMVYKLEKNSLFPTFMGGSELNQSILEIKMFSARLNNLNKWFYGSAFDNLKGREIKTILGLIMNTKGKYVFTLLKTIKFRHLKMFFGSILFKRKN